MEAGGLAVGIVALAGLFNNAMDCFEYVQLGRNFDTNFQTSLLKLENARLRLSRWGQAVGLSGDPKNTRSLQAVAIAAEDTLKAERLLGQILYLFADAEGVSTNYKSRTRADDPSLMVLDVHSDMDPLGQSLYEKMRNLSTKRQNRTPLRQKVKWALYEEKHFKRLIEDIVDLVNNLVREFPAVQQEQQKLCKLEVSEIGTSERLFVLRDIAASQDKDLENAIAEALPIGSGSTIFNNNNSKIGQVIGIAHVHGAQTFTFS
ncbi:hypothetical protein CC80DRAFT_486821 [Byssothecium circinans]|uniref:Prion-inhibition and propagation HeLo domain-containing protein n=1 Tax=Byssothecium circinans TaxID=147558 RepID=A0A6A5UHJ4_9PLEO|nr:hypothetical protein CC80DRAFT_486821 [Byssothecium circinans]